VKVKTEDKLADGYLNVDDLFPLFVAAINQKG
jgi:hypothetical protein